MKKSANAEAESIAKVSTGITGLDEITHGGFPEQRVVLIRGGAGTGKTVMGLEFLYRAAGRQEPGIFVSFEETAEALRFNARAMGWDIAGLEADGKFFLWEAKIDREAMFSGTFTIDPLLAVIKGKAEQLGARRIVIDAIDVLLSCYGDPAMEKAELYRLHDWLAEQRLTTILTAKTDSNYEFLDYLADCVLFLDLRTVDQVSIRRLRVIKYRGSGFGGNEYPFIITNDGNVVMPISSLLHGRKFSGEKISIGNSELDQLLGGGLHRNSSVLVAGPPGSGKTTLAANFSHAACLQGRRVLYVSFEESRESILASMLSPGIDLRPACEQRRLEFFTIMPEALVPEQHLYRIIQKLSCLQPDHLVVDAISACRRMAGEAAAFAFLTRLISYCAENNITCLMTNQCSSKQWNSDVSGFGLLSIIDTLIMVNFQEIHGCLERELLIWKSRGAGHSNRRHSYTITDQGIRIEKAKERPAMD